jgi:hypothetical protein
MRTVPDFALPEKRGGLLGGEIRERDSSTSRYARTMAALTRRSLTVSAVTASAAGTLSFVLSTVALATTVPVHVQRKLVVRESVHVTFRAKRLPERGYYYGVIVLKPYRRYTRSSPPPCSTSSNMQRTDYGYPQGKGLVALALTPAKSSTGHWCAGGSYEGAIYAVPHAPPCESTYPCRSEPYEPPSPCWNIEGRRVCGVVARPREYAYPDGLPAPLASGTTIVGRFSVRFPG